MAKLKIALVEDDEILSKVIYEELIEAGFAVERAHDGEAGLKLIQSTKPDLVLLGQRLGFCIGEWVDIFPGGNCCFDFRSHHRQLFREPFLIGQLGRAGHFDDRRWK